MSDIFFGKKLKEVRLKQYGLRKFAELMDMKPSELSKIERGYKKPPSTKKWFRIICEKLGFDLKSINEIMNSNLFYYPAAPDEAELYQLWKKPFVMQKMSENFIPAFVCTTDGNPIEETKFRELMEWLNNIAKEHNKKADEYNSRKK